MSQSQGTPVLTPDQIAAIHSKRVAHVDTSIETIPQQLAKTSGDLYVTGSHITELGEGTYAGYPPYRLRAKTCQADLVVLGRAGTATSHMTSGQYFLYSDWGFLVEQVFKDNSKASVQAGDSIIVVRPGGVLKIGERTVYATEKNFQDFKPGDEYLLFLEFIPETGAYIATAENSFSFSEARSFPLTKGAYFPDLEAMDEAQLLKATSDAMAVPPLGPHCGGGTPQPPLTFKFNGVLALAFMMDDDGKVITLKNQNNLPQPVQGGPLQWRASDGAEISMVRWNLIAPDFASNYLRRRLQDARIIKREHVAGSKGPQSCERIEALLFVPTEPHRRGLNDPHIYVPAVIRMDSGIWYTEITSSSFDDVLAFEKFMYPTTVSK